MPALCGMFLRKLLNLTSAFCRVVMRKLREDDEENFRQELFRTLVGAKPYSDGIPAKLYNINKEYLTFEQVRTQTRLDFKLY